jgi:hypothetical protein
LGGKMIVMKIIIISIKRLQPISLPACKRKMRNASKILDRILEMM